MQREKVREGVLEAHEQVNHSTMCERQEWRERCVLGWGKGKGRAPDDADTIDARYRVADVSDFEY